MRPAQHALGAAPGSDQQAQSNAGKERVDGMAKAQCWRSLKPLKYLCPTQGLEQRRQCTARWGMAQGRALCTSSPCWGS